MARIHRWSVMIYGSLQAEFMETKYNSHVHGYGTSVFGKIVVNISKSINSNNKIFIIILLISRSLGDHRRLFVLEITSWLILVLWGFGPEPNEGQIYLPTHGCQCAVQQEAWRFHRCIFCVVRLQCMSNKSSLQFLLTHSHTLVDNLALFGAKHSS